MQEKSKILGHKNHERVVKKESKKKEKAKKAKTWSQCRAFVS